MKSKVFTIGEALIDFVPTISGVELEGKELTPLEKSNQAVWANYAQATNCPYRLNYHIMAPTGWLNDPNGLIQFKGEYHVFYQHHPFSAKWGPMHWGHISSKDLVHWEHQPIALAPDQAYEEGCFSGSAVDNNGILTLIYTAHDDSKSPKEVQCIAISGDGIHFIKDLNNPVINCPPSDGSEDFRDPKVWKHEDKWYMIVGSGKDGKGKGLLYASLDLKQWEYLGVVSESNGTQGDMWECPDLFELGDKHIIITSPMNMENGKSLFIVGDMNYGTCKFTQLNYQEADYGEDFYAPQSFKDEKGRRIIIAWMDMWGKEYPSQKNGWAGAMTIPRELLFQGDKVISKPVEELKQLRKVEIAYQNFILEGNKSGYLKNVKGAALEIQVSFKVMEPNCSKFGLVLRASEDYKEKTLVYYDLQTKELVVDKSQSGEGSKNNSKIEMNLCEENNLKLHIFIDKSSVEVFANDGEVVVSNRIYPSKSSIYYDLFAEDGNVGIEYFHAWELKTIWD